jgi:hypothetical protein
MYTSWNLRPVDQDGLLFLAIHVSVFWAWGRLVLERCAFFLFLDSWGGQMYGGGVYSCRQ